MTEREIGAVFSMPLGAEAAAVALLPAAEGIIVGFSADIVGEAVSVGRR